MVKAIILKIDGTDIEVSLEETRKLYSDLKKLFGEKERLEITYPAVPSQYPIKPVDQGIWYVDDKTITFSNDLQGCTEHT